jgi:hypothetical protein
MRALSPFDRHRCLMGRNLDRLGLGLSRLRFKEDSLIKSRFVAYVPSHGAARWQDGGARPFNIKEI